MGKIVIVLPRGRRFGPKGATAIDLCVRDFVSFSRRREDTVIVGEPIEQPFPGLDFRAVPRPPGDAQWLYAERLADFVGALSPDLVVVHQHMPSATRLAKRLRRTPVLIHRHNAPKSRPASLKGAFGRWRDEADYARFARTIWVSDFCRDAFVASFPQFASRAITVHNGLDFQSWRPAAQRRQEILFVGRLTREKGCLESAQALARMLPRHPDWSARFILSKRQADPDYEAAVLSALAPLGAQARLAIDAPHDQVQTAFCEAAIALAPSLYEEPFGRTAIEAFAGGAALACSMRGGLREIAEGFAQAATPPNADTIEAAIERLIASPEHRTELAASGRRRGETLFDIRAGAAKLDALYDEVAREAGIAR